MRSALAMELVVTRSFLAYAVGDLITSPSAIAELLPDYAESVVVIAGLTDGVAPVETLNILSVTALVGLPCQINGMVANGTLSSGLNWSVDGGVTWSRAANFVIFGASWSCNGPVYLVPGIPQSPLILQDIANPVAMTSAPQFSVNPAAGVAAVAGLTGTVSAISLKGALSLAVDDIAGLGDAAVANFGTVTGSVADGGALQSLEQATDSLLSAGQVTAIAGLQGIISATVLKTALAIDAADVAGLGNAATSNFGTVAGSVADGGALASVESTIGSIDAAGLVNTVAGLQGSISAVALKTALAIDAADVAGLGDAATRNFGTVAGSVADGGALSSLTDDISSVVQATPANVSNALAAGRLAGVTWADAAGSAATFSHGTVPTPAYARSNLLFGDRLKLAGSFNFAEIWDTEANYDAYPKLQAFLLYCQSMALAMKNTSLDSNCFRMNVTAYLPRGTYLVSQPLVVPEYVNLHTDGMIVRTPYTGDQSSNGTTSAPGAFYAASAGAQAQFEPTVIITPRAHASRLNVYVGNTNINFRGSGIAIGKTWQAELGQPCAIGAAGSGYSVNDLVVLMQPQVSTYWNWVAQVTAVNASGGITAAVVSQSGGYGLPPALQQQQWTAANGFDVFDTENPGCFLQYKAYQANFSTPSPGTGATLAPTWTPDFLGGQYNIGAAIQTDTLIGHLSVTGFVPPIYSQTYGGTWAVMITGLNGIIDEIEVLGGNDGVYCRYANDWRITTMNCVGAGCGLELYGCGSIECPNVVFDTCGAALLVNQSDRVQLSGLAFFEQANLPAAYAFPASLANSTVEGFSGYSAIQIGQASTAAYPNAHLDVSLTLVNMGGLPATTIGAYPGDSIGTQSPRAMPYSMTISYTFASRFDIRITNIGEAGGAATLLPSAGFVCFGQTVDASNEIRGTIDGPAFVTGPAATQTTGHGWPACSLRIWDAVANGWQGAGGTYELTGSGAPLSGTNGTGAGKAAKGSTYRDLAGPGFYIQSGTTTSPAWTQIS